MIIAQPVKNASEQAQVKERKGVVRTNVTLVKSQGTFLAVAWCCIFHSNEQNKNIARLSTPFGQKTFGQKTLGQRTKYKTICGLYYKHILTIVSDDRK
jgi:hypothetical protein